MILMKKTKVELAQFFLKDLCNLSKNVRVSNFDAISLINDMSTEVWIDND